MFDGMAGGWLEPGETDVLDFDTGKANPAGASKEAAHETYVKAWSPTGNAKVEVSAFSMDRTNKPDHAYLVGTKLLEGTDDSNFIPEVSVGVLMAEKKYNWFAGGHVIATNKGATRVKVWRVRYVGPG